MTLDITTLFAVLVVVSAMSGGFVGFLYRNHRGMAGIGTIAASYGFLFLGLLLIALRTAVPPMLSFVVGNILVCIGYLLTLRGIALFFGRHVGVGLLTLVGVAYSLQYIYFFVYDNNFAVRLFFYLTVYAVILLVELWIILAAYRRVRRVSHLVAAAFVLFQSALYLVIAVVSLTQDPAEQIFSPTTINALVVLGQTIFMVGWTLSFTLMVSERLTADKQLAEASSREKSDALANMSHELRTPLNAIIGFADVIDSEALGPGHPRYREYIKDILSSGRHLLLLIEDILDISKIEAGKLELAESSVVVAEAVGAVMQMIRLKAGGRRVALETELDPRFRVILADDLRLRQILLNVLSNAVKFSRTDGRVRLSTRLVGDGHGEIEIADTGIGMDEAGIRRALMKYGRVDDAHVLRQEGIGLGLPLAVALTIAHGGSLDVASTPGFGTVVTLSFPPGRCRQDDGSGL